jgi:hypothetical protein
MTRRFHSNCLTRHRPSRLTPKYHRLKLKRTLFAPCLKANKGCVCISSLYTPAPLSFMKTDCWPASRAIISQIPHLFTFFTRLRYVRPIRVPEEIASTYSATFFQTACSKESLGIEGPISDYSSAGILDRLLDWNV